MDGLGPYLLQYSEERAYPKSKALDLLGYLCPNFHLLSGDLDYD